MRQVFTKTRKERRQEAKQNGVSFKPRYSEGLEPRSYEDMYGVGYERFDDKFTNVSVKIAFMNHDKSLKGRD